MEAEDMDELGDDLEGMSLPEKGDITNNELPDSAVSLSVVKKVRIVTLKL
jgi:hypothetical protein